MPVDVTVVGSGPNGLAAALTAARAGLSVRVIEGSDTIGGGARTEELVESGFLNDRCSAVHPMALASPFFRDFGLAERVSFVTPPGSYAHVSPEGCVSIAYRDLGRTAETLGEHDATRWRRLLGGLVRHLDEVTRLALSGVPLLAVRHPAQVEYGVRAALRSVTRLTGGDFDSPGARALLASVEAHAIGAGRSPSAVFVGLALAAHAHSATGWPIPVGGSQAITDALVAELVSLGATIETGRWVRHVSELDDSAALLLDVTPAGFLELTAGHPRAESFRSRVRHFRYGPGIAKLDITLDGPIPWTNQRLSEVGTVHLGGDQRAIIAGERAISRGRLARTPFILVSQPSVFDATRAPEGKHVVWAYAHVPPGSPVTMSRPIIAAIEKQAPGFRDLIRNASQSTAWQLPAENPNYVGGDISAGATSLRQILGRPYLSASPWRSPVPGVYLCSASTAPGPGVHGMSGWYAAREALRHEFGIRLQSL